MDASVKVLSTSTDGLKVGGYGVVWGGVDTTGDYFDRSTDFWFDRLNERPMVLYQHGGDGMLKRTVVGQVVTKRADDTGLWIEAQLTASKQYLAAIKKLIDQGVLGWSSGAVGYLVDRVKQADGRAWIKSWPIAEFSLTPTPAEPRTLGVRALKSLAAVDPVLEQLGEDELEDARSLKGARMPIRTDDLPDSAFAYVEPGERDGEGKTVPRTKRHFPHHDSSGVLDPGLLASAIAAAAVSPLAVKALPHLLREQAGASDADADWWKQGAAADLLVLSHKIALLAAEAAEEQGAQVRLGEDVKDGRRLRPGVRLALKALIDDLAALHQSAEHADRDTDGRAALDVLRRRLALAGVMS